MSRFRRSRPQNKWLKSFILENIEGKQSKAESLKVLKHVSGPHDDGTVIREVTDSQYYMNAEFTKDAIDNAQSADDSMQPDWDKALILVTKYDLQFKFHPDLCSQVSDVAHGPLVVEVLPETSAALVLINHSNLTNFILVIKAFKIWDYQIGFHLKNRLSHYLQDAKIYAKVKESWETEKSRLLEDKQKEVTDCSLTLTQLIGQMSQCETQPSQPNNSTNPTSPQSVVSPGLTEGAGSSAELSHQDVESSDRDLAMSKVSSAIRYVRRIKETVVDMLTEDFTAGKLRISDKDRRILDEISEWKEDYIPSQSQDSGGLMDDLGYLMTLRNKQKTKEQELKKGSSIDISRKDTASRKSSIEHGNKHVTEDPAPRTGSNHMESSQEEEDIMDTSTGQPSIHLSCSDSKDSQPIIDGLSSDDVYMNVNISSPQENQDVHLSDQQKNDGTSLAQQNEDDVPSVKSLSGQSESSSDPNNNSQDKIEIHVTIVNDNMSSQGFIPVMPVTQRPQRDSSEESSPKFGPGKEDSLDVMVTLPFNPKLNTQEKQEIMNHESNEDYTGTCPFSPNLNVSEGGACDCVNETVGSHNSSHEENVKSSGESNQSLLRHFDLSPILASNSGDCHNHSVLVAETEQSETRRIQGLCEPDKMVDTLESPRLAKLMQTVNDDVITIDHLDTEKDAKSSCHSAENNICISDTEKRKRRNSSTDDAQSKKKLRRDVTDETDEMQSEKNNEVQSKDDKGRRDSSENEIIEGSDPSSKSRGGLIASVMNSVRAARFFWSKKKDVQTDEDNNKDQESRGIGTCTNDITKKPKDFPNESNDHEAQTVVQDQCEENPNSSCHMEDICDLERALPGNSKDISSSEESIRILVPRSLKNSPKKNSQEKNMESDNINTQNQSHGLKSGKERCEEYLDSDSRNSITVLDRCDRHVKMGGVKDLRMEDSVMFVGEGSSSQHGDSDSVIVVSSNSEPKELQGEADTEEGQRSTELHRHEEESSNEMSNMCEARVCPNVTDLSTNLNVQVNEWCSPSPRKPIHKSKTRAFQQNVDSDSGLSHDVTSRLHDECDENFVHDSGKNLGQSGKDSDCSSTQPTQKLPSTRTFKFTKSIKRGLYFTSDMVHGKRDGPSMQQNEPSDAEQTLVKDGYTTPSQEEESDMCTVQTVEEEGHVSTVQTVEEESNVSRVQSVEEEGHVSRVQTVEEEGHVSTVQTVEEGHVSTVQTVEEEGHVSTVQTVEEESHVSRVQSVEEEGHVSRVQTVEEEGHVSTVQTVEEGHVSTVQTVEEEGHVSTVQTVEEESHVSRVQSVEEEGHVSTVQTVKEEGHVSTVQTIHEESHESRVQSVEEESCECTVQSKEDDTSASSDDDMEQARQLLEELLHIPPKTEVERTLMSMKFPKSVMKTVYHSFNSDS